jgi:glycosyltransferase involved in cell wall biosynthesis
MKNDPYVSLVVIGLNEANNLVNTFEAIKKMHYPPKKLELIYVDSGSTDTSVAIAEKYADKVVIENSDWPTPARGRNRGLLEANHEIIHFIDGDIQIDPVYLRKAVKKLQANNVHAVFGYLEELSIKGINRILLSHWEERNSGFVNSPGAGGTFKRRILLAVQGYDERILRGEETELGIRMMDKGYKIFFLNEKMGVHNYDVGGIFDYLKVQFNDGKSKSYCLLCKTSNRFFIENVRKSLNNIVFVSLIMLLLTVTLLLKSLILFLVTVVSYFLFPVFKILFKKRIWQKNRFLYYYWMELSKPATFIGQVAILFKFFFKRKSSVPAKKKLK